MADRILKWLDRLKNKIGTKTYNLVLAIVAIMGTIAASTWGAATFASVLSLLVAALNNVALFLLIIFTLQYFQGGTKLNVQQKVFEEGNVAAAIYQGLIYIGIAILIGNAII